MMQETQSRLTEDEAACLPDAADVAWYREHGYWLSRQRVFSDAELDGAIAGQDAFYRGERDLAMQSPAMEALDWQPGTAGLRKSDYAFLRKREIAAVVRKPLLGAIAARLAGVDEVRVWHDQLLYKPSGEPGANTSIGWHTDRGYWLTCSSEEMITAWVPFHDVEESMGPMVMVDGSHLWPDNSYNLDFFGSDLEQQEGSFVTGGNVVRKVPVLLKRGHVSFHHVKTIHGSARNVGNRARRALAVHLQPGDNRFVRFTKPDGTAAWHPNDFLVRQVDGAPDYTDPEICPVIWANRTGARPPTVPGKPAAPAP